MEKSTKEKLIHFAALLVLVICLAVLTVGDVVMRVVKWVKRGVRLS